MPLSIDVTLPASQRPVFPRRCLRCGGPKPEPMRFATTSIGWWVALLIPFGRKIRVRVPVCRSCWPSVLRQRWFRRLGFWLFAVFGIFAALYLRGGAASFFESYVAVGIVGGCMIPWFIWTVVSPPVFDMTARAKTIEYEFRNADYAEAFAQANGGRCE